MCIIYLKFFCGEFPFQENLTLLVFSSYSVLKGTVYLFDGLKVGKFHEVHKQLIKKLGSILSIEIFYTFITSFLIVIRNKWGNKMWVSMKLLFSFWLQTNKTAIDILLFRDNTSCGRRKKLLFYRIYDMIELQKGKRSH